MLGMTIAMWALFILCVLAALGATLNWLYSNNEDLTGALVVISIIAVVAGLIVCGFRYDAQQHSYRDTIRVQLAEHGYNVVDVEDAGYYYDGYGRTAYTDGWSVLVNRKSNPSCSGAINVVIHNGDVKVVNDLPC